MFNLNDIELNKVCRTCLSPSEDMKSLYEGCSSDIEPCLADILMSFTSLKCHGNDGLPSQICHNCNNELNRAHAFKLKCLESDKALSYILENESNDNIEEFQCPVVDNNIATAASQNDPLAITESHLVKHEIDKLDATDSSQCTEKPYSCTDCLKTFAEIDAFIKHTRTHTGEKPYSCTVCHKTFKRKDASIKHMRTHTGEKPYSCTTCDISYSDKTSLKNHMRWHSDDKPHVCQVCDQAFPILKLLRLHMSTHPELRPFPCSQCHSSFKRKDSLQKHMRTHTGEKPYSCTICDISYSCRTTLAKHMRRQHEGQIYSCTVREDNSPEPELDTHSALHFITNESVNDANSYSCTECDSSFCDNSTLKNHMQMHKEQIALCTVRDDSTQPEVDMYGSQHLIDNEQNSYSCTECDNLFCDNSSLKKHMQMHKEEITFCAVRDDNTEPEVDMFGSQHLTEPVYKQKAYPCTECDSSFNRKANLAFHMYKHAGNKPHSCTVCHKTFTRKDALRKHMRIHTGEKPYSCTNCDISFADRSSLKNHMRWHSDNKPHVCTVCDQAFPILKLLRQHTSTHPEIRPFPCSHCDSSFKRKDSLQNHIRTHTGEKPYSCTICDVSFSDRSSLTYHTRRQHKGEIYSCTIPDNHTDIYDIANEPLNEQVRYSCTECDSSFCHKEHLALHMHKHSGKKPYSCTICNCSYNHKTNLKVHLWTHEKKMNSCQFCKRLFKSTNVLKEHMRMHVGAKPYSCTVCDRSFNLKKQLNNHVQAHTEETLKNHIRMKFAKVRAAVQS